MAEVSLTIGGRGYRLACRNGEEEALRAAGQLLDDKVAPLLSLHGQISEPRLLLMGALQLAGELLDGDNSAGTQSERAERRQMLENLLSRVESLADRLEQSARRT